MRAFISYSHRDADLLALLHTHLAALRRQGRLIVWHDREIPAGGVIDEHVAQQLEDAELYLLLISAAFIESRYCYEKEFARALKRQKARKAIIVPIVLRDCDWKIPDLRQFKAPPEDGKAVTGRHWHTLDEAFANVAEGLRSLLEAIPLAVETKAAKPARSKKTRFIPDESHVTDEQRERLREIAQEVVERLAAKAAKLPPEQAKEKVGRAFGILWTQFNEHFETTEHGMASLPRERFEEAKTWLLRYRASKDKNLKRTNPEKYRHALTRTIFTLAGKLHWSDERVHAFAGEVLAHAEPVESLKLLGINQLEFVRDRVRYEMSKRTAKAGQAKAKKRPEEGPALSFGGTVQRKDESAARGEFVVTIDVQNDGNRTARNLRIHLSHTEAGSRPCEPKAAFWQHDGEGPFDLKALNPWRLRAVQDVHPGERIPVLTIPCSAEAQLPLEIDLRIWAEDYTHAHLTAAVTASDLAEAAKPVIFHPAR
jgi:hypothetical protein